MDVKVFILAAIAMVTAGCANKRAENNAVAKPNSYYETLRRYVAVYVIYPPTAIHANEQGVCRVRTSFLPDGKIIETKLAISTGFEDLDRECVAVFERITAFPPVPESLVHSPSDWFTLDIPITFAF